MRLYGKISTSRRLQSHAFLLRVLRLLVREKNLNLLGNSAQPGTASSSYLVNVNILTPDSHMKRSCHLHRWKAGTDSTAVLIVVPGI